VLLDDGNVLVAEPATELDPVAELVLLVLG
jgi:hypothetical protein